MHRRVALALSLALLAACPQRVDQPVTPPSITPIQAKFDDATIRAEAAALADRLSIDRVQRTELLARLDDVLASPAFVSESARAPVRAVGVYRQGEGGLVVKVGRGDGLIRTADAQGGEPFVIDSLGAGAVVGGSARWGIVLALGLDRAADLEGKYAGVVKSATALDESVGAVRMKHRQRSHTLWFVGVAEGLSANAGGEEIRFTFGEPQ
jgi:hypothetical protein